MFRNYLKIAVRSFFKHKLYSVINVLGLAVGIAASVLIFLYVRDETGYDRFHANVERIYRVQADWSNKGDSKIHQLGTPSILARTLRDRYPQAEAVAQICGPLGDIVVKKGDIAVKESDVFLAESDLFRVFTFPLVRGYAAAALKDPNTAILSESLAAKVFGPDDPLGRSVEVQARGQQRLLQITGVARDVPRNSHFRFEMLVSTKTFFQADEPGWTSNNFTTYLLLRPGVTQALMEEKLVEVDKLYFDGGRPHIPWIWTLEPLGRIHLQADLATGNQPNGSAVYVKLFSVVAVLVLLIAGINFVNLATARAAQRAREVGIRKIVGSLKRQLVGQFLGESVLVTGIALLLAVAIIQLVLPLYRSLVGRALSIDYFGDPVVIPALLGLALAAGILAGLYPAFFLTSFRHVDVLKGSPLTGKGRRSLLLRNGLVVFQFAMSVLLILGSLTIGRQLEFVKNRRLGFEKEHVVVVHDADALGSSVEAFAERLKQNPDVRGVSAVRSVPGLGTPNWGIGVEGVSRDRPLNMNFLVCDQDFTSVLDVRMLEGRFLSRDFSSDAEAMVINKKAADYFGLPDPVGKKVQIWTFRKAYTVVGIMDNVYFESLHRDVRPMGYLLPEAIHSTYRPYLLVRAAPGRAPAILSHLRKTWDSFATGLAFDFSFLDARVEALYQNDRRAGNVINLFSVLAIFVSCLGLFGLAAFVTEKRTKEIGIRKVLGADLPGVVWLLTRQFVKWVVLATLIAWPLGYWAMSRWLEGFAFQARLGADLFLVSGMAALGIAVLTVSSQVIKAARANPADSIRYE
jgi:putative ABC transport system permease protein